MREFKAKGSPTIGLNQLKVLRILYISPRPLTVPQIRKLFKKLYGNVGYFSLWFSVKLLREKKLVKFNDKVKKNCVLTPQGKSIYNLRKGRLNE